MVATERFWRRGEMAAAFVETIADIAAPTAVELAAGEDLTDHLFNIEGLTAEAGTIAVPDLGSKSQKKIAGETALGEPVLTIYDYKDGNPLRAVLDTGVIGYLVINPYEKTLVATDEVEVYPVQVASKQRSYGTDAAGATWQCKLTITDDPETDATVA